MRKVLLEGGNIKKKIIIKYILLYLPMISGIVMFSCEIINLFSTLLLFCGGYIAVKNTFDCRVVKRNINKIYKSSSAVNEVSKSRGVSERKCGLKKTNKQLLINNTGSLFENNKKSKVMVRKRQK